MIRLYQLLKEDIGTKELKDALSGNPYDIEVISLYLKEKVKNFAGLGYVGYGTYSLNFTNDVEGMKTSSTGSNKKKQHMISGKDLKSKLIPDLLRKSGKAELVYVVTKEPVFKPGMTIGGDGYWKVK